MPTSHRRIPVIQDEILAEAIDHARRRLGADRSAASIIRELALRGAAELQEDDDRQRRAADELMSVLREPGLMEWEALEELRRRDAEPG